MKKIFIFSILLLFPIISVNAISCYDGVIDSNTGSFECSEVNGTALSFKKNGTDEDFSKYFSYTINEGKATITLKEQIKFDKTNENGYVKIVDDSSETIIRIKNPDYVKPTEATTTTTTLNPNTKIITVTLDNNDGTEATTKTCSIVSGNDTCSISLPKLNKNTFTGWGTAKTCKEGNSGTIKVDKDITYYACYSTNNIEEKPTDVVEDNRVLLKTLKLTDSVSGDEINFGTFSIKKQEYSFKVLNEVENITVEATSDEGVTVEVIGNENLIEGENEIIIKLTSSDSVTNEYKLVVTRLKKGEVIDNNLYLKSLVIGGYTLNFNKDVFNYTLTILNDVTHLEITAIAENEKIVPEITGNDELVNGSKIQIKLLDGETETSYTINIVKEETNNMILYIALGVIGLLIIVLVVLIILKSKKNKTPKTNGPTTLSTNKKDGIEVLNI